MISIAQNIVGVSAAAFAQSQILRGAFVTGVCWTLRPFSDCSKINITDISDANFFNPQNSAHGRLALLTYLTRIDYTLFFSDNYEAPASATSDHGNPGAEKSTAMAAAVANGDFFATFTRFATAMAIDPGQQDPADAALALAAIQTISFAAISITPPTYVTFLPNIFTASPTLSPTHAPTPAGLLPNLTRTEAAAAVIIFFSIGAALCAALGGYLLRRHRKRLKKVQALEEAVAARVRAQQLAAALADLRKVAPEVPLTLEELEATAAAAHDASRAFYGENKAYPRLRSATGFGWGWADEDSDSVDSEGKDDELDYELDEMRRLGRAFSERRRRSSASLAASDDGAAVSIRIPEPSSASSASAAAASRPRTTAAMFTAPAARQSFAAATAAAVITANAKVLAAPTATAVASSARQPRSGSIFSSDSDESVDYAPMRRPSVRHAVKPSTPSAISIEIGGLDSSSEDGDNDLRIDAIWIARK